MIDLKSVINQYPEYVQDGKKLKSLLSDLYPSESLYVSILCSMLDDGVVDEIKGKDVIDKLTFTNLSSQIEAKHGYAQKYIDGCLSIWANAFGIKIIAGQELPKIVPIKKPNKKEKEIDTTIHTHKFKTIQVEPTCTEKGYTLHRCDCGYEYKDNFVNAKHDFVLVEYIEPTCEKNGRELYKCTRCGEEKEIVQKAKGHVFGAWIEQVKPSCEKNGFALRQCKRCGKKEKRIIKATGHSFSEWRQDDNSFVRDCDRCGKTEKVEKSKFYCEQAEELKKKNTWNSNQQAFQAYMYAAELGNVSAMFWVGWMYHTGTGVGKNLTEAIKWYQLAAKKKHPTALNNLGKMYETGELGVANYDVAKKYYEQAVSCGSEIAKNNLKNVQSLLSIKQREKTKKKTILITSITGIIVFVAIIVLVACLT